MSVEKARPAGGSGRFHRIGPGGRPFPVAAAGPGAL